VTAFLLALTVIGLGIVLGMASEEAHGHRARAVVLARERVRRRVALWGMLDLTEGTEDLELLARREEWLRELEELDP
jgi:hypothetical protein